VWDQVWECECLCLAPLDAPHPPWYVDVALCLPVVLARGDVPESRVLLTGASLSVDA